VTRSLLPIALAATLGCAASPYDRAWLADAVRQRTGHSLRGADTARDTRAAMPPGVSLDDGVTEDEAVAAALWNNPSLQATLADLGVARADLTDANQLPNPTLALLFPIGARPIESWLAWPIEALWQRPRRVQAALADVARVAQGLVQNGLDVARDARVAHADAVLADARAALRTDAAGVMTELRALADARVRAGDLDAPSAAAVAADAASAQEAALRAEGEAVAARAQLRLVMGVAELPGDLTARATEDDAAEPEALPALLTTALVARPDVRAAELALEAAGARIGWERARVFGLVARADVFGPAEGMSAVTGRVGLQATLPIFNQNQGAIGRAEAEIERAAWRVAQARQSVIAEVTSARATVAQSARALRVWRAEVLPATEASMRGATDALAQGETSALPALDATRRHLDARVRHAELVAALRRACAQLQRSIGGLRGTR
jgi:cobalt-zinc-cadmium efflux system outer membrane protein